MADDTVGAQKHVTVRRDGSRWLITGEADGYAWALGAVNRSWMAVAIAQEAERRGCLVDVQESPARKKRIA